jgi:hypothetical protein
MSDESALFTAWNWFQWFAIRFALLLAVLTLVPSAVFILIDVVMYVFRTIVVNTPFIGTGRTALAVAKKLDGEADSTNFSTTSSSSGTCFPPLQEEIDKAQ